MSKDWRKLPSEYDGEKMIAKFYKDLTIVDIVEYMKSVIEEWRKDPVKSDRDESVRSKELPLIVQFKTKASKVDIKKYSQLLDDFEIVDDDRAVSIARELNDKPKQENLL